MNKLIVVAALLSVLPVLATAEMKMQNSDPSPTPEAAAVVAPEHVMQNSDPNAAPTPEHTMKNTNPKKWVSSNAATLEEKHSGKYAK